MESLPISDPLTLTAPLETSTSTAMNGATVPTPENEKNDYITIASTKRATLASLVPPEWRVPESLPNAEEVPNVTKYALKYLTAREADITEKYTAEDLVVRIAQGVYSSVEVLRAFGRRAVVADQLVSCRFSCLLVYQFFVICCHGYVQSPIEFFGHCSWIPLNLCKCFA